MACDRFWTQQDLSAVRCCRLSRALSLRQFGCLICLMCLAIAEHSDAASGAVRPHPRGLVIDNGFVRAVVADGAIVELTNVRTGEVHATGATVPAWVPAGMGVLRGHAGNMEQLHTPNSRMKPAPRNFRESVLSVYHVPASGAKVEFQELPDGGSATWTGLTDGSRDFPLETLKITARSEESSGIISLVAECMSPERGVFGLQVPIVNLHGDHTLFVPSFGGVMYKRGSIDGLLCLGGGAPYLEAPVIAAEGRAGSLCMWWEDPEFSPCFGFLSCTEGSIAIGLERMNLMPFEEVERASVPALRIAVTAGGWSQAMRSYRDWYTTAFGAELQQRESVAWASKIRVIVDQFDPSERSLRELAGLMDPSTVMLHDWEPRAAPFDTQLPEWSPRDGYLEKVLRCKSMGFRTMGYVNTYCVNVGSPVFESDLLASFALPRRIAGYQQYQAPRTSWETLGKGDLAYLDSVPQRWRDYHCDSMVDWNRRTRTDANYEDVGSTAGDYGNGKVEGLSGPQGGAEMFRALLRQNPGVPMASEHCAEHMAFASKWPMRYPQKWGDPAIRRSWMSDLRPVTTFIHGDGSRPWVPTLNAETEEGRILVAACADALGGVAQVPARPGDLRAKVGVLAHLRDRAMLFSGLQLEPDFSSSIVGDPVACRYRDKSGAKYAYETNGLVQEMRGPSGTPVYQRITSVTRFDSPLWLGGWPACNSTGVFGLNPDAWYCLTSIRPPETKLTVEGLSEGAMITRYVETRDAVLLCIGATGGATSATVRMTTRAPFVSTTLNDCVVEGPGSQSRSYETPLPARFVFAIVPPPVVSIGSTLSGDPDGRYVGVQSGIERGTPYLAQRRTMGLVPGLVDPQVWTLCCGGGDSEITMDYLIRVPDSSSSMLIGMSCPEPVAGNGVRVRACINGQDVHLAEFVPTPGGHSEAWMIPIGRLAGQTILLTIGTDGRGDDNCDVVWWTRPTLVSDGNQRMTTIPAQIPR